MKHEVVLLYSKVTVARLSVTLIPEVFVVHNNHGFLLNTVCSPRFYFVIRKISDGGFISLFLSYNLILPSPTGSNSLTGSLLITLLHIIET